MRKILAVALAALQIAFLAGMIGYHQAVDRHMATDAVEYEFAADGRFWYWSGTRELHLSIRQKGTVNNVDRYWAIETGPDGVSTVRRTDMKPVNGAYIDAAGHKDSYFYQTLSKTLYVSNAFEQAFFPGVKERYAELYIEEYGEVPDDMAQWYGTDDINEPAFGHTFTVKAKVWKGSLMITDYLIDGQSIKAYIQFSAQETSDAESG